MKTRNLILIRLAFIFIVCLPFSGCEKNDINELDEVKVISTMKSTTIEDEYNELIWSKTLLRSQGKPEEFVSNIQISGYEYFDELFKIEVNPGMNKESTVSSAIVKIDDQLIFGPPDFPTVNKPRWPWEPRDTSVIQAPHDTLMHLEATFNLEIELRGSPGDSLSLSIMGKLK